jgi:hydrogenase maturation protease
MKLEYLADKLLIHAVGNETRRDDGISLYALEFLRELYPEADFKTDYQLYLEDVLEWCTYDRVWLIDASYNSELVTRRANEVELDFNPSVHHMGPDLLASMAKQVYQSNVKVFVTELPGTDFSLGEGLSDYALSILKEFKEMVLESNSPIQLEGID